MFQILMLEMDILQLILWKIPFLFQVLGCITLKDVPHKYEKMHYWSLKMGHN